MTRHERTDDPLKGKLLLPVVELHIAELVKKAEKRKANPEDKNPVLRSGRPALLRNMAKEWDAQRPQLSFRSLSEAWLEDYFSDEYDHVMPNTRRVYKSWIVTFIKYGQKRGLFGDHIDEFDAGDVSEQPSKKPLWLPGLFFKELYEAQHWYFRGVLAFLTHSLCRGGEVITIRVGDLELDNNRVNIRRHKTKTYDRLPLTEELQGEMRRYLMAYRDAIGGQLEPDMYLFPRFKNNAFASNRAYPYEQRDNLTWTCKTRIIEALPPEMANDRSITLGLGAHAIRRAMARYLYERLAEKYGNADAMRVVQGMLGHTDIKMTQRYIGQDSIRQARDTAIFNMTMYDEVAKVLEFPTQTETAV